MIQRREVDVDAYQTRISELEKELQSARDYLEHWKGREEEMRQMSLDLERERGKLAGGGQVSPQKILNLKLMLSMEKYMWGTQ